jgi:hypothetical protein
MLDLDDETGARADLQRIVGLEDAVLRNLLITQRYHDLSLGITSVLGRKNVNWSTFATWASKTAGESIRDEELPKPLLDLIEDAGRLDSALEWLNRSIFGGQTAAALQRADVIERVERTLGDVSRTIADGNLKVFAELAPEFLRAIVAFGKDTEFKQATIEAFVGAFRPGPASEGGQDLLKSAFAIYYQARFESDFTKKAQLILLANGQVGLHEQTRLQPNIQGALDAPVEDLLTEHVAARVEEKSGDPSLARKVRDNREQHLGPMLHLVAGAWRQFATHYLMRLALPGHASLSLGADMPPLSRGQEFPAPLVDLALPELLTFAEHYLASLASEAGTGAHDWADLDQRMDFIVDLFRTKQQTADLLDQPFDERVRTEIEAGRVPAGPVD